MIMAFTTTATMSCVLMMSLVIAIPTVTAIPLVASGQVYYVKPNDSYHCPVECHTLAYYVANVTTYFTSNTTMIFLPGNHSLANGTVQIGNITDLTLIGNDSFIPGPYGLPPESTSRVECNGSVVFSFENITGLVIQNLTFLGCGGMITVLSLPKVTALYLYNIFDLTLSGVTVRNSSGYGLYGDNILGTCNINGSTFAFNSGSHSYYGGNMELYYDNCPLTAASTVYIGYSNFLHGNNWRKYSYGSGLNLAMQCTNVSITVDNVIMIGNKGYSGGNFAIFHKALMGAFTIPVIINNCHIEGGIANVGAGMYISLATDSSHCSYREFLHISNTNFTNNHALLGGGIYMTHNVQPMICNYSGQLFVIENSTFYKNSKGRKYHAGGAVVHTTNFHIPGYLPHSVPQFQWSFINCYFSQNFDAHYASSAAIFVHQETSVFIVNSTFQDNNCTAITAVQSNIIFSGNVTIAGNTGDNGGGLVLCDGSFMYLQPNTTVLFSGNHAKHTGGAIYAAEDSCLQEQTGCFFQLDTQVQPQLLSSVHVLFRNNTATIAGSAVYGGSIDYCYSLLKIWNENQTSSDIFNRIFHPHNLSSDMSFISSDPIGVCFCDHNMTWHNCSNKDLHVSVYPGETFNISVVVVGQRSGSVPGEVIASFLSNAMGALLMGYEHVQEIKCTNCSLINYTVFSMLHRETLVLTAQSTEGYFYSPYVIVDLKSCPLGFTLTHSPYHCDCVNILAEHGVRCDINGPGINRQAPVWIGCDYNSSEILFHDHCPLDYCKPHDIVIPTTNTSFNQDEQCAFNRKGFLCGECRENLSLTLGSSQCLPCSNVYFLLLLAFAVAGVALVVLIAVCNLTVTEGTINGLIFYANIIQINRATFFPPLPHNSFIRFIASVLTVFISWVNLDLGIQTCFYDGMDTYIKTWLQFAFPIYIWVIAGVIIILSRKFAIFARLVGRNGVQLLATLFLISYAKLQRTIIAAVSFILIETSNSSESVVWLYDGNVPYLQGKHIPLFVVAALFGLVSLPYTFILLFIPCLQKKSNVKLLFWVNRLMAKT